MNPAGHSFFCSNIDVTFDEEFDQSTYYYNRKGQDTEKERG